MILRQSINPTFGTINLPPSRATRAARATRCHYPAARVTDNRAEFTLRLHDHQRNNSPRQRRLREEYNALLASRRQIIENIIGVIVLGLLIIAVAFFA